MKIAYLILAHNTPKHTASLIRQLDSENVKFFVHIDKKASIDAFVGAVRGLKTVEFIKERVPIFWGEFSIVQATLNLMKAASLEEFDYLILLSGCDYPIRGNSYIRSFLSKNQGKEFINIVPMPCSEVNKNLDRLEFYKIQNYSNNRIIVKTKREFNLLLEKLKLKRAYKRVLNNIIPYAGSQWWALTQDCSRYILEYVKENSEFTNFFKNTLIPDEMFFQTIIGTSKFKDKTSKSLTQSIWIKGIKSPILIGIEQLSEIKEKGNVTKNGVYGSGENLFLRKFPDNSQDLIHYINKEIIEENG